MGVITNIPFLGKAHVHKVFFWVYLVNTIDIIVSPIQYGISTEYKKMVKYPISNRISIGYWYGISINIGIQHQ